MSASFHVNDRKRKASDLEGKCDGFANLGPVRQRQRRRDDIALMRQDVILREAIENRRLFFSNVHPNITPGEIEHFFNGVMHRHGLCFHEHPIKNCKRVDQDNSIQIEFVNAEITTRALHLNRIEFKGKPIWVGRPQGYSGPQQRTAIPPTSWQEFASSQLQRTMAHYAKLEKKRRELVVLNVPTGVSPAGLSNFFSSSMGQAGLTILPGDPIAGCKINTGKRVAFLNLRTEEETKEALNMNNIPFQGQNLQIERPFPDDQTYFVTWQDLMAGEQTFNENVTNTKDNYQTTYTETEHPSERTALQVKAVDHENEHENENEIDEENRNRASALIRSITHRQKQDREAIIRRESIENRRLCFKNVPAHVSENSFGKFLDSIMRDEGLLFHEASIINITRVNHQSDIFLVDFMNAEMADRALNLNGIHYYGATVWVGRPPEYAGPALTATTAVTFQEFLESPKRREYSSKAKMDMHKRELVVKNLPPGTSSLKLEEFLNGAINQAGLSILPGSPITSCKISSKTQFAFLHFRTEEEAEDALNLFNIPYRGHNLHFERSLTSLPADHATWQDFIGELTSNAAGAVDSRPLAANSVDHESKEERGDLREVSQVAGSARYTEERLQEREELPNTRQAEKRKESLDEGEKRNSTFEKPGPSIHYRQRDDREAIIRRESIENRRICCFNVPTHKSEVDLRNYLGSNMGKNGLSLSELTVIKCTRVNPDEMLVDFVSAEFATRALRLSGIRFGGYNSTNKGIRMERPPESGLPTPPLLSKQLQNNPHTQEELKKETEREKNMRIVVVDTALFGGVRDYELVNFLNAAMRRSGLNILDGDPITKCKFQMDKTAVVTFRIREEAEEALNMNNIRFEGQHLRLVPFIRGTYHHVNWEDLMGEPTSYGANDIDANTQDAPDQEKRASSTFDRELEKEIPVFSKAAEPKTIPNESDHELQMVAEDTSIALQVAESIANNVDANTRGAPDQEKRASSAFDRESEKEKEEMPVVSKAAEPTTIPNESDHELKMVEEGTSIAFPGAESNANDIDANARDAPHKEKGASHAFDRESEQEREEIQVASSKAVESKTIPNESHDELKMVADALKKEDMSIAFQVAESIGSWHRQLKAGEAHRAKLETELDLVKQDREKMRLQLEEAVAARAKLSDCLDETTKKLDRESRLFQDSEKSKRGLQKLSLDLKRELAASQGQGKEILAKWVNASTALKQNKLRLKEAEALNRPRFKADPEIIVIEGSPKIKTEETKEVPSPLNLKDSHTKVSPEKESQQEESLYYDV
jgi:hypothetical protein